MWKSFSRCLLNEYLPFTLYHMKRDILIKEILERHNHIYIFKALNLYFFATGFGWANIY